MPQPNDSRPLDDAATCDAVKPGVSSLAQKVHQAFRCRVVRPLLRLLRGGISPKRLAWSLAVAILIGVNPLLGTTTVVMLAVAWLFHLDYLASQIGIHLVTPLQWLLFLPFVHAGILLFHSRHLPMDKEQILHLSHRHPIQLVQLLWQWEWHALVVWAVLAGLLAPVLASQIRRLLILSLRRHAHLLA